MKESVKSMKSVKRNNATKQTITDSTDQRVILVSCVDEVSDRVITITTPCETSSRAYVIHASQKE